MTKVPAFLLFGLLLVAPAFHAVAQIPRILSYQGVLTDTLDKAKPDGAYSFTFRLYTVPGGGSALWQETKLLPVVHGLFATSLGDVTPLGLPFDVPYFLGVQVGADPEMAPRIALTSSGYSLRSLRSDTATVALHAPTQNVVDSARIAGTLPPGAVGPAQIASGAVTAAKIATGQVVKSLNGLTDVLMMRGSGGATVTSNGDTIIISATSGGGGLTLPFSGSGSSSGSLFSVSNSGSGTATGVFGEGLFGVWGHATGSNGAALFGQAGPSTRGIIGEAYATAVPGSPINTGVVGLSQTGIGVYAGSIYGDAIQAGKGIADTGRIAFFENNNTNNNSNLLEVSNYGKGSAALFTVRSGSNAPALEARYTSGSGDGITGRSTSGNGNGVHGVGGVGVLGEGGPYGVLGTATTIGVWGTASATSGNTRGVYGIASSPSGAAIYGTNSAGTAVQGISGTGIAVAGTTGGTGYGVSGVGGARGVYGQGQTGVWGQNAGSPGYGVYGESAGQTGVYGNSSTNLGVFGFGGATGMYGKSTASTGSGVYAEGSRAVWGYSTFGYGSGLEGWGATIGVYGHNLSGTPGRDAYISTASYAGEFYGNVAVVGNLSKSGGSFKIDHPLDPAGKYLSHSFVESPDMKNIYDGVVTLDASGAATVQLPDWCEALNRDFRYQLTAVGAPGPNLYIAQEVKGNAFRIAGGTAQMKVSWQLTGIRQDAWANAHRIPVEESKPAAEVGTYLHPELFGQAEARSVQRGRYPTAARLNEDLAKIQASNKAAILEQEPAR